MELPELKDPFERIQFIAQTTRLSLSDLARLMGYRKSSVFYGIKSGKMALSHRFYLRLNRAFPGRFPYNWVVNGVPEPYVDKLYYQECPAASWPVAIDQEMIQCRFPLGTVIFPEDTPENDPETVAGEAIGELVLVQRLDGKRCLGILGPPDPYNNRLVIKLRKRVEQTVPMSDIFSIRRVKRVVIDYSENIP